MDLNYLLSWVVGFVSLLTLLRTLRAPAQRRWAGSSALTLVALGASLVLVPDAAGLIAGGVWSVLFVVPATAARALSRALLREEFRKARWWIQILRCLMPIGTWDRQLAFVRALELAQSGRLEEAEASLERLKASDENLARSAELHMLRLRHRWEEIVEVLSRDIVSGCIDPQGIVSLLRALGETGRPDELVKTYAHFQPILSGLSLAQPLRKVSQLYAFAFSGRVDDTARVLEDSLHFFTAAAKEFWLATADMAAGEVDRARRCFERLRTQSSALGRRAAEHRLACPLPAAEGRLTSESQHRLDDLQRNIQEEARYEIRAARSFRRAHATKIFMVLNLLMFAVEEFRGGSENVETLFRLGALDPDTVRAGEWWRLIMASFLHFGPVHLASNLLGLYILGPFVELSLGSMRFSILYLVAGLGSMTYCLLDMMAHQASGGLLVGASGSIMALVGAVGAVLLRGWRSGKSRLARRKLKVVLIIVVVQIVFDYFTPQISAEAHLSGLILGFILVFLIGSPTAGQRLDSETDADR